MQEEAYPQTFFVTAQHRGHQKQMVVVNPDLIPLVGHLHDHVCEFLIHPLVGLPPCVRKPRAFHHVVQERPQRGVGIPFIEPVEFPSAQEYRDHVGRAHLRPHAFHVLKVLVRSARPADPDLLDIEIRSVQSRRQPTCRADHGTIRFDPNRQPI